MLRCNANLFRIATVCQSTEETRYYLGGVLIEPHHKKGVLLVATDGHRLICIHDETGHADESAIIKLNKDALKACAQKKGDTRELLIETGSHDAVIRLVLGEADAPEFEPLATAYKVRIDGSFPDYRRVIPTKANGKEVPAFNGAYLGDMGAIGVDLKAHFSPAPRSKYSSDVGAAMMVSAEDAGSPAMVLWPFTPQAFAVLMPVRAPTPFAMPCGFFPQSVTEALAA